MMSFNEFGDDPLEGGSFDAFGETQGGSQLNNPLGLSDKDMQLQYDNFPTNPEPSAEEGDEEEEVASANPPSSPGNDGAKEELEGNPREEEANEELDADIPDDSQPETSKKPELNANMLFGSDSEDETPADRPRHSEEPNDEYGVTAKTPVDADNSDAGSIKSDVDPNDVQMSDFDIMMSKKSEERKRAFRRRKGQEVDLINDYDEQIQEIISDMKKAAENDRKANQRNECAFNKLKMLPVVINSLQKQDLQTAFLDCGILSALADWLAPLPDGNLTHLKIRESILKLLGEMSGVLPEQLKNSGIGKAVMLLYKHPKEMKENRAKAGKLIQEWSRPIFGTSANYRSMSREEREDRDLELMNKRRQSLEEMDLPATPAKKQKSSSGVPGEEEEEDVNKEIPRARVPQPSMKDYVIRPKSQMSMADESTSRRSAGPKTKNRFEKHIRGMKDQSRSSKSLGNHVSLQGGKL